MGTNVYARRKPTEEENKEIIEAIQSGNYNKAKQLLESKEEYHIGKRSSGWQFLFEENKDCYENTRDSINEFISRDDISLVNEYDEELTASEFWFDYVDSFSNGDTYASYYKKLKETNPEEYAKIYRFGMFGTEKICDGLRFTSDKDWC